MTIDREELDRLRIDFSDVATGRRLPPVHPGTILRDDFLKPMDLSVYRLARELKVSRPRLNEIVRRPGGWPARCDDRHRAAAGALFRDNAGVLGQSASPLRPRCSRTHGAAQNRSGGGPACGVTSSNRDKALAVERETNRRPAGTGVERNRHGEAVMTRLRCNRPDRPADPARAPRRLEPPGSRTGRPRKAPRGVSTPSFAAPGVGDGVEVRLFAAFPRPICGGERFRRSASPRLDGKGDADAARLDTALTIRTSGLTGHMIRSSGPGAAR